jgi:DoxX-like family
MKRIWAGRILSTLAVVFLTFDGVIKVLLIAPVVESCARLGIPIEAARRIGILELACLAVYLIRPTAVLGAVLLTGFLGGAIAIHLRIGDPLFSHVLFPSYIGTLLWVGLYLRDDRLRAFVPRAARA